MEMNWREYERRLRNIYLNYEPDKERVNAERLSLLEDAMQELLEQLSQ
jgi:hypothetical protein